MYYFLQSILFEVILFVNSLIRRNSSYKKSIQQQQSLGPKILVWLWYLNRLVRVGHMYSFLQSILFEVIPFVNSLIDMLFFINSTNVSFCLPLHFVVLLTQINSLFVTVHCLLSSEHDQTILNKSPSSFHQQGLPQSLNRFPHFKSYLSKYSTYPS